MDITSILIIIKGKIQQFDKYYDYYVGFFLVIVTSAYI